MRDSNFDDVTRQSALEIITTVAEKRAAILRKHVNDLKDNFFTALALMMTEFPHADDLEAWLASEDTELLARTDPASAAADSLGRVADCLGEKTTLLCSSHIVKSAIESTDWKEQVMGFTFL